MADEQRCNHFNAVRWNGFNNVVQCHLCGEVFVPQSDVWGFIEASVDQWLPDRSIGRDGFDDIERAKVREFLADARARFAKGAH